MEVRWNPQVLVSIRVFMPEWWGEKWCHSGRWSHGNMTRFWEYKDAFVFGHEIVAENFENVSYVIAFHAPFMHHYNLSGFATPSLSPEESSQMPEEVSASQSNQQRFYLLLFLVQGIQREETLWQVNHILVIAKTARDSNFMLDKLSKRNPFQ